MNSSEKRHSSKTKIQEVFDTSIPTAHGAVGEPKGMVMSGGNALVHPSPEDNAVPDSERAGLQWEFEKFLANFTFFLDLALKAVGLFYAILGGILSIYFAKDSKNEDVVKFLLFAPLIMSIILGLAFLIGGYLWQGAAPRAKDIADKLKMTTAPNFNLLTWLLYVFGFAFLATGAGLIWLIYRLV